MNSLNKYKNQIFYKSKGLKNTSYSKIIGLPNFDEIQQKHNEMISFSPEKNNILIETLPWDKLLFINENVIKKRIFEHREQPKNKSNSCKKWNQNNIKDTKTYVLKTDKDLKREKR